MASEEQVTRHYVSAGIAARVLAAMFEAHGKDAVVTIDALAPLDQFHGRGPLATRELVALLKPQAGDRLLDIGSGIGGPARWCRPLSPAKPSRAQRPRSWPSSAWQRTVAALPVIMRGWWTAC